MSESPVALVTGSSRGIGNAVALFLRSQGYRVVGCSRSGVPGDSGYEGRKVDVTDEVAVRALVSDVARELGRIDVLVNNAGTFPTPEMALLSSAASVESAWRTNFLGTYLVGKEAAKVMTARRFGRIINLASAAVPLQMEGASAYTASKAAVIQLSKVLAKELARFNVTCNVVAPSLVDTDMLRPLRPKALDVYLERLTLKRFNTMEEVCDAVWFFARPESGYVTGQVLYLGINAP